MRFCLVVALLAAACSTKQKTTVTDEMFEDPERRTELLEATLRVMDAHPEYVDQMVRMTLHHPKTLKRQFEGASRVLADEDIAKLNANALVAHPRSLEVVMVATLDAAKDKPAAKRAIVAAIQKRSDVAAEMLVEEPQELGSITASLVAKAWESDNTKTIIKEVIEQAGKPNG